MVNRFVLGVGCVAVVACGDSGTSERDGGTDGGAGIDADITVDSNGNDGGVGIDAEIIPIMSIREVRPQAASRTVDTPLEVFGTNIVSGATVSLTNCDTNTVYSLTPVTVDGSGGSLSATLVADSAREQGLYTVTVENPDGQTDVLECAFRVLAAQPPTVTSVTPNSAFNGVAGDGVNSDQVITIGGTGFISTPAVRWVKTDGSEVFNALFVGFGSDTELTAVAPSETLAMPAGEYHVEVINPDLLSATWQVDDMAGGTVPGIFTITTTPPPLIADVAPAQVPNADCLTTTMVITGADFGVNATAWWVAPSGTVCAGSETNPNGDVLCPVNVTRVSETQLDAQFGVCPPQGAWPLTVRNADGQADTFFLVEIRNSNDGHLDSAAFDTLPSRLNTARFKHGAEFGFDPFGNAYIYASAGQDAAGGVLGSTEFTQLDAFGNAGPFQVSMQYVNSTTPRAMNSLGTPRQGATLVRVGRTLFTIGGAAAATDVAATVNALTNVERAEILSYQQVPAIKLPQATGANGLPVGSWYYRVSALGPWGEGLASREVVLLNQGGEIEICWDPPSATGATSYHVYRSLSADGRGNTAAAIAYEVAGPCFVDTGADEQAPAPGNVRGVVSAGAGLAQGDHVYRVSATLSLTGGPWETYAGYESTVAVSAADVTNGTAQATLNWDSIAGATYSVYKWDSASERFRLLEGGDSLAAPTFIDTGAAFDGSDRSPRAHVMPLPPGSLSVWDDTSVPALNTAREGLDSVVIALDPAMSSGVAARILVAGGRTANTAGSYLTTAESLGILEDGTLEASWFNEVPQFNHARAFYALVTTQFRNDTPVPPDPEEPPCGDLDGDGFVSCDCAPVGTPTSQLDCNDADPGIHPGATEVCGDGVDQDCDMGCTGSDLACTCSDDADGDGHISKACGGDDCCDSAADTSLGCTDASAGSIFPGATDVCENGIDENCDDQDATCDCADDLDQDGHVSIACGGADCCDTGADVSLGCTEATAPNINPDQTEVCANGVDDNCDGFEPICRIAPTSPYAAEPYAASAAVMKPPALPHSAQRAAQPAALPRGNVHGISHKLVGDEPVYVVAVLGDDEFSDPNTSSRSDMEACLVGIDGHLACGTVDGDWEVQSATTPQDSFGIDAFLYRSFLYPFYGLSREDTASPRRDLINSSIARFPVNDPAGVTGDLLLGGRQSANVSATNSRAYYKGLRLVAYIYLIGGWVTDNGGQPTDTVERHLQ